MDGTKTLRRPIGFRGKIFSGRSLDLTLKIVYFAGCLLGVSGGKIRFLQVYADSILPLMVKTDYLHYFTLIFLPQYIMYTALLFSGLSAIGCPFIPALFLIKGYSFGIIISALYKARQWQGLAHIWAFLWLPEALCLCLMLYYAGFCWKASRSIAVISLWHQSRQPVSGCAKRAIHGYIFVCSIAAFVCLISSVLQVGIVRLFF